MVVEHAHSAVLLRLVRGAASCRSPRGGVFGRYDRSAERRQPVRRVHLLEQLLQQLQLLLGLLVLTNKRRQRCRRERLG